MRRGGAGAEWRRLVLGEPTEELERRVLEAASAPPSWWPDLALAALAAGLAMAIVSTGEPPPLEAPRQAGGAPEVVAAWQVPAGASRLDRLPASELLRRALVAEDVILAGRAVAPGWKGAGR